MDFALTDEQRMLVDTVRRFIRDELAPLEDGIERTGVLAPATARAVFEKSRALGLYGMNMPEHLGGDIRSGDGRLDIRRHGAVRKFVDRVDQITFCGPQAAEQGQEVLYVTERAVFRLTGAGLHLTEVAPGIEPRADVLDRMGFAPQVSGPATMPEGYFRDRAGEPA